MFRCDVCGSVTPPRTPCSRVVIETRPIEYPKREKIHWQPPKAGGKGTWIDDPGGVGSAIVRELRACPACARQVRERDGSRDNNRDDNRDDDPPVIRAS
jgi:hypothetical protein